MSEPIHAGLDLAAGPDRAVLLASIRKAREQGKLTDADIRTLGWIDMAELYPERPTDTVFKRAVAIIGRDNFYKLRAERLNIIDQDVLNNLDRLARLAVFPDSTDGESTDPTPPPGPTPPTP